MGITHASDALQFLLNIGVGPPKDFASLFHREQLFATFRERFQHSTGKRIQDVRDAAARRALILGRVSLYLENLPTIPEFRDVRNEIDALRKRIEALRGELSPELVDERMASIISILGTRMAGWARRLKLEHSQFPLRIDFRRLTVVADSKDGPIPMDRMGSGENWVGYHLIAHLALHSWFVAENRPVPRFLFFRPTVPNLLSA